MNKIMAEGKINGKNQIEIFSTMEELHKSGFNYDYAFEIEIKNRFVSPRYKREVKEKLNASIKKNIWCILGLHNYKKTKERNVGGHITEYFKCDRCGKEKTWSWNSNTSPARCVNCGKEIKGMFGCPHCGCNAC